MKLKTSLLVIGAIGFAVSLILANKMGGIFRQSDTGIRSQTASMPNDFGAVPDFSLTDASGKIVRRQDLLGYPWVADFIFTRCQGQCPIMTSRMKELKQKLPGLPLVSFSVDPYDTPAVLAQYKQSEGADWLFLCGHRDEVKQLSLQGFHLAVASGGDPKEFFIHSSKLVLVDKQGRIRGYFDGTDAGSISNLANQARPMVGAL